MAILEVRDLTKCFGALAAVNSVDFSVENGEILGMIGPNGAGKSTLFNVIMGVYKPDKGEVVLKGRTISGLKPHKICRMGIAKTSQIVQPFAQMTVLENVLVGGLHGKNLSFTNATREAEEILEFVGLGGLKGMASGSITVSDRRRLELARAIATGAEIILLDENMAGLNPTEMEEVLKLLREIREQGKTLIVVALKSDAEAILITGGTGISPSDVTIEGITPMLEKQLPGFGELFRKISYDAIGSAAMMTRATAGVVRGKAIFCLPGSPDGVTTAVSKLIIPELGHVLSIARQGKA